MRHQKHGVKLGRTSAHRRAMWSNMVTSLIEHGRIETTDVKAKELRRLADRTINWSASLGDILTRDNLDVVDTARKLHAMRMAKRVVKQPDTLRKLFNEVGPRFIGRPGGFTRVMKKGYRHGDAAPISIVELVERGTEDAAAKADTAAAQAPKAAKSAKKPSKKAPAAATE